MAFGTGVTLTIIDVLTTCTGMAEVIDDIELNMPTLPVDVCKF